MKNLFWVIAKKEFFHLFRYFRSLGIIFFLPIFLLILFGYAVSFEVEHLPLVVWDEDYTFQSRLYLSKLIQSKGFDLVKNISSMEEGFSCLDGGRAKMVLHFPKGFARKLARGQQAELQVFLDGSDPTIASSALTYLASISQEFSQGLLTKVISRRGLTTDPIKVESRVWYNENLRSLNFFVPGLICIILMMISAALTSQTIILEKEKGAIESLVVSPISKYDLMLGKILPYVLIAFIDVLLTVLIGHFWFQVPLKGNLLLLLGSSFIFLTGAMGIGVFISTNARSSQEAMMIALILSMLPTLLLSGFIFPIENMPRVLQGLSYLIPARYFLKIVRGVFLKGVGLNYLWKDELMMLLFSLVILGASARSFKKRIT